MTTETVTRETATEAPRLISHWINGAPVEVAEELTGPVYNPASGQVIARVPRGGADEVEAAVRAAR
ncbi:MAG TPA: methylmalonate-semialdehyde dehydrogenase (CoA acylating), partial [Candidatus Limnocylindria bacterium]